MDVENQYTAKLFHQYENILAFKAFCFVSVVVRLSG